MKYENIDTLIFDYGGVLVNVDDSMVVESLKELGLPRIKQFIYRKKLKDLLRDFIDGLIPTEVTLERMLQLCKKGTTKEEIIAVLCRLCGNLPKERLEALVELRKRYKVYLLSNICDILWVQSMEQMRKHGYAPEDCFDRTFLSYEMGVAKPDRVIYEKMIAETGINPGNALYFDDRKDNCATGAAAGLNAVVVPVNMLETTQAFQAIVHSA